MKIVRLIPLACLLSLLAACGADTITGPDARRRSGSGQETTLPGGTLGSGN